MNDVEKIVAYNNIRSYLNKKQQKELLKNLDIDEGNLLIRLRGLNIESEFYTILHLLKSCKHILSFDEGTSVLTNSYSPDSLLVLTDDRKFFIEIKSKEEFEYKISGGNLQKRIDFANEFGYKLYFAVKLKSFWGLYSSDYLQSKKGKLIFPDDYNNSDFEQIFNSKLIILPKGIKVKSYYSNSEESLISIKHPDYGNLYKYEFYYNDSLIFLVEKNNEIDAIRTAMLELLQDAMSQQSQETITNEDNKTIIIGELTENTMCWDYQFLLAHISHTITNLGTKYDTTAFYKTLIEKKGNSYVTMELLFIIINQLIKDGVPIIVSTLKKERYDH